MAEIQTSAWSETAGSNNTAPPDGWPENMARRAVNDCAREMMAAIKRHWNRSNPTITAGGTANAITLTYGVAPPAYVRGMRFSFVAGAAANTGAATVNVNSLGALSLLRRDGGALAPADVSAGTVIEIVHDGAAFRLASDPAPIVTLASLTASNSPTLDFTNVFSDLWDRYELELLSLVPQNNDVSLALRVGTGAGPTWQSGAGAYETNASLMTTSVGFLGGIGAGIFLAAAAGGTFGVGNQAGNSLSGTVEFCNPDAALVPTFDFRTRYLRPAGNGGAQAAGSGFYGTSGAITGLQLLFSSGNIVSGGAALRAWRKR